MKNTLKRHFELPSPADVPWSKPMEGLRGVAIFLTFLTHYCLIFSTSVSSGSVTAQLLSFGKDIGHIGVDLFFILSGFLIYRGIIGHKNFQFFKYMKRRITRIYPVFIAVFAIYVALAFVMPQQSKVPDTGVVAYFLSNFFLLPGIVDTVPMIGVAWSLSFEMFYYIAIPLLILALRMQHWNSSQRILFFSIVAIAIFAVTIFLVDHPSKARYVRLAMFISGILVYELYANKLPTDKFGGWMLVATLIGISLASAAGADYGLRIMLVFVLMGLSVHGALASQGWFSRFLSWSPMRWLGNISYSYYLIHFLVIKFVEVLVLPRIPVGLLDVSFYAMMVPVFVATLIPSVVLFLLIEKPYSIVRRS